MASQGPNNPGTVVNDNSVGIASWNNPSNASSSNNSYALCSTFMSGLSNYLKATNFGFSIPSGATIDGIVVEVEMRRSGFGSTTDFITRLVKGGVISGDNKATVVSIPSSDTYFTYGSSTDLWGLTLDDNNINASDFGVVVSTRMTLPPKAFEDVFIDHISITVHYTSGAGPTAASALLLAGD